MLISSKNPSPLGENLTLTATVTPLPPVTGTPTGTVTFLDGTFALAPPVTPSGGVASITVNNLLVGTHNLIASYSGDNFFAASQGNLAQTISKGDVTFSVSSSLNPSAQGQVVTFTVVVNSLLPSVPRTGQVTFVDGSTLLGPAVTLDANATASLQVSSLAAGLHNIQVNYLGDGNYNANTSAPLVQRVLPAAALTLTSSVNPSGLNRPVTFTVTATAIPPTPGQPTGTVTFLDGTKSLGVFPLQNGTASLTTSTLQLALTHNRQLQRRHQLRGHCRAPLVQTVSLSTIIVRAPMPAAVRKS